MPTALQRSRDIMAQGVARLRSGLINYGREQGEPGPEIAVQPFDAANVSTPAALIKLGTSIAAARRKRANFEAAREGQALEREKTQAEIARLRAQAVADLRGPAPAATPEGERIVPSGEYAGKTYSEARILLATRRAAGVEQGRADTKERVGRTSSATAELAQVEAGVKRVTEADVTKKMASYEPLFRYVYDPDPKVRAWAAQKIGIRPEDWEKDVDPNTEGAQRVRDFPNEAAGMIDRVRKSLRDRTEARLRAKYEQEAEPRRQRALAIIREGSVGFGSGDPEADESGIIEVDDQGNPVQ